MPGGAHDSHDHVLENGEIMTNEMPMILDDASAMVRWFIDRGTVITTDEYEVASTRLGRARGPELLSGLWDVGFTDANTAADAFLSTWIMAEWPGRSLDADEWLEMFGSVGFTRDGRVARRPEKAVTLYRAALPAHAEGMTWTDNLEVLDFFADTRGSNAAFDVPHLRYRATVVDPPFLLAEVTGAYDNGRGAEVQWIVDPLGLDGIEVIS